MMTTQHNFERMVLPHRDALYGHALALTHNADEAEDLVQETTLRALRGFDTFRADGPIRAWLLDHFAEPLYQWLPAAGALAAPGLA